MPNDISEDLADDATLMRRVADNLHATALRHSRGIDVVSDHSLIHDLLNQQDDFADCIFHDVKDVTVE